MPAWYCQHVACIDHPHTIDAHGCSSRAHKTARLSACRCSVQGSAWVRLNLVKTKVLYLHATLRTTTIELAVAPEATSIGKHVVYTTYHAPIHQHQASTPLNWHCMTSLSMAPRPTTRLLTMPPPPSLTPSTKIPTTSLTPLASVHTTSTKADCSESVPQRSSSDSLP